MRPHFLNDPLPNSPDEITADLDYWVPRVGDNQPGSPDEVRLHARIAELRHRQLQLSPEPNHFERIMHWPRENKIMAIVLFVSVAVIGLGAFTDAVQKIVSVTSQLREKISHPASVAVDAGVYMECELKHSLITITPHVPLRVMELFPGEPNGWIEVSSEQMTTWDQSSPVNYECRVSTGVEKPLIAPWLTLVAIFKQPSTNNQRPSDVIMTAQNRRVDLDVVSSTRPFEFYIQNESRDWWVSIELPTSIHTPDGDIKLSTSASRTLEPLPPLK